MLILKLKRDEIVFIEFENKVVELKVTGYRDGTYRTAINAPKEVGVTRDSAKVKGPRNFKEQEDEATEV